MKYSNTSGFNLFKTALSCVLLYIVNTINCHTNDVLCHKDSGSVSKQDTTKKVYIHYMGWYGDTVPDEVNGDSMRHWRFGHANTPQIGCYDSKNQSLLTYHVLLSWSCGIDGIVINVKDDYDDICMKTLIRTIKWIREIDSVNFRYDFGISYDDQGFDLTYPYDTTYIKLSYLRDSIIPTLPDFLKYNDRPALFVFDYPEKFMTASNFRSVLNTVFMSTPPIVIWNSPDDKENSKDHVDAFYPWVQPGNKGWDREGANWGKEYLDWYYSRVNEINTNNQYIFTCGGVWPGFDDTKNTSWGGNRIIARRNGQVYDSAWSTLLNYNRPLPLYWVIIETWNDWNEGTEIEPSIEEGYKYLLSTIRNVNTFKGTAVDNDIAKFETARKIYEAFSLIENGSLEPEIYYPILKNAIREFLRKEFDHSLQTATSIISKFE